MKRPVQKNNSDITRRGFLKAAVVAAGAPLILPGRVLGLDGGVAPSNRITMGCIGINGMGTSDMQAFLGCADAQIVAVCDVERAFRERGKGIVEKQYADQTQSGTYKGCDAYNDFREVLGRADIDAVMIGTPDQWHVLISIAAAKADKDIYCEKPVSRCVAEGRALCEAIKRYSRVFQTGTQLRSRRDVRFACELVRNGRIGKLHTIRTYLPAGTEMPCQPTMPVPDGFDYDMWLGPAPWAPYTEKRCHYNFRHFSDYSGGTITDLGAHDNDIAQWGNGTELSGPVEVEGAGIFPKDGLYDNALTYKIHYRYANGVELICSTDPYPAGTGVRFEGTDGWVFTRWGVDAEPKSLLSSVIRPDEIHLYESLDHQRNFLDCVKSRRQTICPAEVGHRSATVCHIGNIAMKLGRKLKWDPERECFENDPEANRMLEMPMRAPWKLEA